VISFVRFADPYYVKATINRGTLMKIYTGCIPCFARQAVEASEMATDNPELRERIIRAALKEIARLPFDRTPPYAGVIIHRIVRKMAGDVDPYKKLKTLYNRKALEYYPFMKKLVDDAKDRFETAVRLAIAGNNIDFGVRKNSDVIHMDKIIKDTLHAPFRINHLASFRQAVRKASRILYIADNAGELVFDRVLIEEIPDFSKKVMFVVKGHHVLNDATMQDAREAGLTDLVRVIDNGSDAPGTIVDECSEEFRKELADADLVIAKGQGNYETLSEENYRNFFLLKAKCPVIAGDLGVEVGDIVLLEHTPD